MLDRLRKVATHRDELILEERARASAEELSEEDAEPALIPAEAEATGAAE